MPKSRKEANRTRGARVNASNLGITASAPPRRSVRIRSTKSTQCSDTCSVSERETSPHAIVSAKAPGPERWREVLACIRDMRSRTLAPVDTMGCQLAHLGEELPENQRFSTLVALMLSSQTKDEVMHNAVLKLRKAVGGSLSVDAVRKASPETISGAINKVGFWRKKTQYIKVAADVLFEKFGSDVPNDDRALESIKGVGPKMSALVLQVAWKRSVAICVDVHVHRITNHLGWHVRPTENPEETRKSLEAWLPNEHYQEMNHLLVGFGQTICKPRAQLCDSCDLNSQGLCPQIGLDKSKKVSKRKGSEEKPSLYSGPAIEISLES
ncbi:hypothetical protein PLICRDRAFT_109451 [Plicaturopsis crispa FD-325 SS-3]|nr:hypothetical protein PLICRDRAFT_109451 [Plicaturopsis crispa FD-325 SS-3]